MFPDPILSLKETPTRCWEFLDVQKGGAVFKHADWWNLLVSLQPRWTCLCVMNHLEKWGQKKKKDLKMGSQHFLGSMDEI